MNERSRLIAVVGGDGAGKTTVASMLVDRLKEAGASAQSVDRWDIVDNPAYPAAAFLKGGIPSIRACAANMPSRARYLFLLWTVALAVSGHAEREGETSVVIADGYWMKHAASEVAYGVPPDWALSAASELPRADAVLHLCLSPEQAWKRKGEDLRPYECGMDASCSRASFLRHQTRIHEVLAGWSTAHGWTNIDASRPIETVLGEALDQVLSSSPRTRGRGPAEGLL